MLVLSCWGFFKLPIGKWSRHRLQTYVVSVYLGTWDSEPCLLYINKCTMKQPQNKWWQWLNHAATSAIGWRVYTTGVILQKAENGRNCKPRERLKPFARGVPGWEYFSPAGKFVNFTIHVQGWEYRSRNRMMNYKFLKYLRFPQSNIWGRDNITNETYCIIRLKCINLWSCAILNILRGKPPACCCFQATETWFRCF